MDYYSEKERGCLLLKLSRFLPSPVKGEEGIEEKGNFRGFIIFPSG